MPVSPRIDRGYFLRLSGAIAGLDATAMAAAPAVSTASPAAAPRHAERPSGLKLGCQSGPSNAQHFAYFARYGVRNICGSPVIADPERLCPTVAELSQLRELAEKYGLSLDMTDSVLLRSTLVDVEAHPAIVLGDSPQRDHDIEAFQTLIQNCARVGIPAVKYNMSILGVLRNRQGKGRCGHLLGADHLFSRARGSGCQRVQGAHRLPSAGPRCSRKRLPRSQPGV